MADQLFSVQRFQMLTLVDNFSYESLVIRAGQRLAGDHVVDIPQAVTVQRWHQNRSALKTARNLSSKGAIGGPTETR